ncbi:hypothetical protein TNIN_306211, partial [Trichonephila inaurata madagascariensis]
MSPIDVEIGHIELGT